MRKMIICTEKSRVRRGKTGSGCEVVECEIQGVVRRGSEIDFLKKLVAIRGKNERKGFKCDAGDYLALVYAQTPT